MSILEELNKQKEELDKQIKEARKSERKGLSNLMSGDLDFR